MANGKSIRIDDHSYSGKNLKIVWSEGTQLEGTITINGLGEQFGITAHAPISSLSQNLTKADLGNIGALDIYIEGSIDPITVTPSSRLRTLSNSNDVDNNIQVDVF